MATRNLLFGLLAAMALAGCNQGAENTDAHPWPSALPIPGQAQDGGKGCRVAIVRNAALPLCKD